MKRILILMYLMLFTFPTWAAWEYEEQADAMGDGKIKTATIQSKNTINLGFPYTGEQPAFITIRRHPKHGKDIIFTMLKGQLICDYDDCSVTIRFDESKPIKLSASKPSDHSSNTFFLSGFDKFVSNAKKSKLLRVQATFYQRGNHVFEFDIAGLKWP